MPNLVVFAPLDQVATTGGTAVLADGTAVALFNVDGRIFGIADACLRCGASLAAGALRGTWVTCPGCAWQYDVVTGAVSGVPPLKTETFDVADVNSQVVVADTMTEFPRSS